jgi:hypothetical protein
VNTYAEQLEPMDDVVKAMTAQYGQHSPIHEYLSKIKGHWRAPPSGSACPCCLNCCRRISLLEAARRHRCAGNVSGAQTRRASRANTCRPMP